MSKWRNSGQDGVRVDA